MSLAELNKRAPFLAMIRGDGTGAVPCRVSINAVVYDADPQFFQAAAEQAPNVDVSHSRNPVRATDHTWRDAWGCLWHFPGDYLDGQVVQHPLADWAALGDYRLPDPADFTDWRQAAADAKQARAAGDVVRGRTEHGFLFLRLQYLRGFENFMIDLAEGRDHLCELRDMITDYWLDVVGRWIDLGVDYIDFGDDLGHQRALPISPATWRSFFKPAYAKLFALCRQAGVAVYLHTDGYIVDIIGDLIDCGVTILNPQDLVNALDNLRRLAWGKVCIDLDIDRQSVTVFGSPDQIDRHIRTCIETLGSPCGRLMLLYGAYPGTPRQNIAQVIASMEKYHRMWVGD